AAALAEQIANVVRGLKTTDPDAIVHIFAACPNSLLFFLGQQHQGIAPCVVYEFDFDRQGSKTYQPSFVIDEGISMRSAGLEQTEALRNPDERPRCSFISVHKSSAARALRTQGTHLNP